MLSVGDQYPVADGLLLLNQKLWLAYYPTGFYESRLNLVSIVPSLKAPLRMPYGNCESARCLQGGDQSGALPRTERSLRLLIIVDYRGPVIVSTDANAAGAALR
jgi:hypothetical protein